MSKSWEEHLLTDQSLSWSQQRFLTVTECSRARDPNFSKNFGRKHANAPNIVRLVPGIWYFYSRYCHSETVILSMTESELKDHDTTGCNEAAITSNKERNVTSDNEEENCYSPGEDNYCSLMIFSAITGLLLFNWAQYNYGSTTGAILPKGSIAPTETRYSSSCTGLKMHSTHDTQASCLLFIMIKKYLARMQVSCHGLSWCRKRVLGWFAVAFFRLGVSQHRSHLGTLPPMIIVLLSTRRERWIIDNHGKILVLIFCWGSMHHCVPNPH